MGCIGNKKQVYFNSNLVKIAKSVETSLKTALQVNTFSEKATVSDYLYVSPNTINKTDSTKSFIALPNQSFIENNNYKIISELSPNLIPIIYVVKNIQTNNTHLMKIIPRNMTITQKKMLSIFQTLKTINHPNILQYHEILHDDSNYYLITNKPEGNNYILEDQLRKNKFSFTEGEIQNIIQQVLYCLLHLHSLGIIYSNISLQNVLITVNKKKEINVKLISLYNVIIYNNQNTNNTTPFNKSCEIYYTSPEMLNNQYTKKSDVWSVGILMYYLLYGCFPFDGHDVDTIISKIKKGKFTLKDHNVNHLKISTKAKDLITKMLSHSLKERLNSYQCLHHSWFTLDIIPKESTGTYALIKSTILTIMRYIFNKKDFIGLKSLFNENRMCTVTDIYLYLAIPLVRIKRKNDSINKILSYFEFCDYILSPDILFSDSNLSYCFSFIDKDKDSLLTKNDFKEWFCLFYGNNMINDNIMKSNEIPRKEDIKYFLISLENKALCFQEYKHHLYKFRHYLEYL